jgi:hypothetical protein
MISKRFAIIVEDTGRGYIDRMMSSFYHSNFSTKQTYRLFTINQDKELIQSIPHHFDYVLFLHDDIIFCNNFLDSIQLWIEQNLTEENKIVSFYLPQTIWHYDTIIKDKYIFSNINTFFATQAILMKIEDHKNVTRLIHEVNLEKYKGMEEIPIVVYEQITDIIRTNRASNRICLRFWISEWFKTFDGENKIVATIPSFVQHIGEISTLNHPFHRCTSFKGEDWSYI